MRVFLLIKDPPDERATRYWNRNWELKTDRAALYSWSNRWYVPGKTPESAPEIGAAYADMVLAGIRTEPR